MAQTVEYIFSAVDRVSAPLLRMADAASRTLATFERLTDRSRSMAAAADGLDNSLAGLRQRLKNLRAERDLVDVGDIDRLRRYNVEIDGLTRQISRLNKVGRGDGLRQVAESLTGGAFSAPQLAADAIRIGVGGATALEDGMAQVRIMARLDEQSLDEATERVQQITARNRADITAAPAILQQALTQTGDLDQAMAILDAAQRGERAQLAPADVIAQALSRMPDEAGDPERMLDLLTATAQAGGVGFAATAAQLPDLLAATQAQGGDMTRTAGTFAALTASGYSADEAAARISSGGGASLSAEETLRLADAMRQLADAGGATERALAASGTVAQQGREAWNALTGQLVQLGTAVLPVLQAGLSVANVLLDGTGVVVGALAGLTGGWFEALSEGSPAISILTGALAGLSGVMVAHKAYVLAVAAAHKIVAIGSNVLGVAIRALNAAFVSTPIGWIALGIGALAGGIYALSSKTDAATASFASFNSELAKSQEAAQGTFDAALQAAEGSDARAEAIARINTQYGEYLPALLTEKASNDELRAALDLVNTELERKIINKFRDQAMTDALAELEEVRTKVFERLIARVDDGQKQAFAEDFNRMFGKMKAGENWQSDMEAMKKKYDIGGTWDDIWRGASFFLYRGVTGNMKQLWRGVEAYREMEEQINLLYPSSAPSSGTGSAAAVTDITGSGVLDGAANGEGTGSLPLYVPFASSMPGAGAAGSGVLLPDGQTNDTTTPDNPNASEKDGRKSGGGSSKLENIVKTPVVPGTARTTTQETQEPVFKLDSVAVDRKGSGTYNAIVSKLRHVGRTGLSAAASLGVAATAAAAPLPAADDAAMAMPTAATAQTMDTTDYGGRPAPRISAEKFCDQIVIHIADAGDKSMDEIRRKVMEVLMEVTDGI